MASTAARPAPFIVPTQPACAMADHLFDGIMKEQRNAIRKAHVERDLGAVGEDDVGLGHFGVGPERLVSVDNVNAVDQPNVKDGCKVASKGAETTQTILPHARFVIPHRSARIK